MDLRLLLELLPGAAFLIGHAMGGLFWAAGAAVAATSVAVLLRWRWDREMPWLAIATLTLAVLLTVLGVVLDDARFVLVRPTVGALAFGVMLALGALARPSLLERTLGYRLKLEARGWYLLHLVWVTITFFAAGANELARRVLSIDAWAVYNALSDPLLFGVIYLATRLVAERFWADDSPVDHAAP